MHFYASGWWLNSIFPISGDFSGAFLGHFPVHYFKVIMKFYQEIRVYTFAFRKLTFGQFFRPFFILFNRHCDLAAIFVQLPLSKIEKKLFTAGFHNSPQKLHRRQHTNEVIHNWAGGSHNSSATPHLPCLVWDINLSHATVTSAARRPRVGTCIEAFDQNSTGTGASVQTKWIWDMHCILPYL